MICEDVYRELPGINFSSLKNMYVSPAFYKHRLTHPETDKPEWLIGRALHCLVLEPDKFDKRYAIAESIDRLPKDWRWIAKGIEGKDWASCPAKVRRGKEWDTLVKKYDGEEIRLLTSPEIEATTEAWDRFGDKTLLTSEDHHKITSMSLAIKNHGPAHDLLKGGQSEVTLQWKDEMTGLRCKGRADYMTNRIIDLKTTSRRTPSTFRRQCSDFLYHAQAAWYTDGAISAGALDRENTEAPAVIAVVPGPPADVMAFVLDDRELEAGRHVYRSLIGRLRDCKATNTWPGVLPNLAALALPWWAPGMPTSDERMGSVDDLPF